MNWVDIIILVIIALTTFSSLRAGFLRQALALIGFVVGIYGALVYHQRVAAILNPNIGNSTVSTAIAFVLIMVVVWAAAAAIAAIARALLNALGLGWTDNLVGMLVGLLVGLFLTVCFLLLLVRIPIPSIGEAVNESTLASYIFLALPYLKQLLPSDLRIFKVI